MMHNINFFNTRQCFLISFGELVCAQTINNFSIANNGKFKKESVGVCPIKMLMC